MSNLYSDITEAEAMTDYGDLYNDTTLDEVLDEISGVINDARDKRRKALIGKYVIVCDHRFNKKIVRYLQDQSICESFKGHYWTDYLENAKGYTDLSAALVKCRNLQYNHPRVMYVTKDLHLVNWRNYVGRK